MPGGFPCAFLCNGALVKLATERSRANSLNCSCELSGFQKSILRSEAGRRQAHGELAYFRMPEFINDDIAQQKSQKLLLQKLSTEELVRVKTAQRKKKLAKLAGQELAQELGADVCEVLGHTVLLYKPCEDASNLRPGLTPIDLKRKASQEQ